VKYLRYGPRGAERPALLAADGTIRDLSSLVADIVPETIVALPRLSEAEILRLPVLPENQRIGSCVGRPGKFVCIGLNYSDHAAETGAPVPEEPIIFMKAVTAVNGPNDDVYIPPGSEKTDWEVELGIVIGETARHVSVEEADRYILGYCLINDVSERHYQVERGGTWDKGKGYDSFGPIGPWLVTRDEIGDPHDLGMWLEVDGHRYQNGSTRTMIFSVHELVSYVSQFMTLQPGDIISTGTPPGVGLGQKPPVFLKAGQTIRLGIDGLGEQVQRTAPSPFAPAAT
jgi:2-keto-4-pentenoate hydratase/2-oxohepta-3-ene-1,7-dioic acid hydratase in catechol pathway